MQRTPLTDAIARALHLDEDDPVQSVVDRLLESEPASELLDSATELLDRVAASVDRPRVRTRPSPAAPRHSTQPSPRDVAIAKARLILHFDPDELLTVDKIRERRQQLNGLFHPDRQGGTSTGPDPTQTINPAADLLLKTLS